MNVEGSLTKDNPGRTQRDATIVSKRLEGLSMSQIGKELGIDKSTVCRALQDEEVKALLDAGTKTMAGFLPQVMENYRDFLIDDDKTIKLKASQDVTKITGILGTHTGNQYYINIMNQTNNVISDEVISLLTQSGGSEIIDIDLGLDDD